MIAALGAFDGFHKGHQALLTCARERAAVLGCTWGVVTFRRHPGYLLGRENFKTLFTHDEQLFLERFFEIPQVCRIDFTDETAHMLPEDFLDDIARKFGVAGIVVGEDFRFGRNRSGTPDLLRRECARRGWSLDVIEIQKLADDMPICSTTVREAVLSGDMAYAWALLGYPFFCAGTVTHGNERGRGLGFPTANIALNPLKTDLRYGVYAALVYAQGAWRIGAVNIGLNPTFDDIPSTRFEVNLLNYAGNLYDQELTVFLLKFLRGEIRFERARSLQKQIADDVKEIDIVGKDALLMHERLWHALQKHL